MGSDVPGQLLLWYAFAANLVAGFAFFKTARGDRSYRGLALKSYHLLCFSTILAVAYLFYLFFSHDFTIKYVFEYSDRSLPFFYLLSAFWAGQEGTYLLWFLLSALFGYVIIRKGGHYTDYAMIIYSIVNLFFLTMLVKLSPFALLQFHVEDGAGLNPLLQDAWMVVHPPVVFIGYAAAGVPFAIAMAALIMNDYRDWVRRVFPWQVMTALMLAGGNILGGYWAYKTLGWGGYWSWDPVENSSLIPWFVSLALLHGLVLERLTGALRKTNILITALVFILVVYGTFLTRSGVLANFSVHSFIDLGSNVFLIGFLILFVVMTVVLFVPKIKSMGHVPINYNIYGREFFLFTGLLLLFIFAAIVLFWASLPLSSSLFSSTPRAADIATYNSFALPLAILFAFLLTVSPFGGGSMASFVPRSWKVKLGVTVFVATAVAIGVFFIVLKAGLIFSVLFIIVATGLSMYLLHSDLARRLVPAVIVLVVTTILCVVLGLRSPLYTLFIAAALMSITSNVIYLVRLLPRGWRLVGGQLTHFGFGIMIIGILGSSAFSSSEQLVLPKGESNGAYGVRVSYQGMESDINHPHNKLILMLDDGGSTDEVRSELYYSQRLDGIMKKPYIKNLLLYDLYYSPQQVQEGTGRKGLRLVKGEGKGIGEYAFTFIGFAMDQHNPSQSALRVTAQLQVTWDDITDTVEPALVAVTMKDGSSTIMDYPARFGEYKEYEVSIDQILAEEGAVVLSIPGLVVDEGSETLVLDVSRKPVINLVWAGTTLILLGSLIAFIRRRKELPG
jgi:cytochrome c-type biogenesis protein CcmF